MTETGIVAIARAASTALVEQAVEVLIGAGVTCVELTLTMPGALDAVALLAARFGEVASIGAGSVLTAEQAEASINAGARFLVAPSAVPDVVECAVAHGVPCLPGALTPSEIVAAWSSGAAAVKLFPASVGGVAYLRDVRAPLPDIPLVPTGGVRLEDVEGYVNAGAIALGVGGPLFGSSLTDGDMAGLAQRAGLFLAAVAGARRPA
jgi:2-dehydro-3-deoxyphosphogluconate aldolase/(4S)-4-hydroxy-2-oxoglutarate aldolase